MITLDRNEGKTPRLEKYNEKYIKCISGKSFVKQKELMEEFWNKNDKKRKEVRKEIVEAFKKINKCRCTFCTQTISDFDNEMTVEHIECKSKEPSKAFEWTNMLCSCHRCNTKRGTKYNGSDKYIDPTTEKNVERYFVFTIDGGIHPNNNLKKDEIERAQNMIDLYGLDDSMRRFDRRQFIKDVYNKDCFAFFKNNDKYVKFLNAWLYYKRRIPYGK